MILCLETSTAVCSVSLVDNGNVVALRESLDGQNHAEKITLFIDEVMKEVGVAYKDLDAIATSMGPGSYTGLRIGVSTAKGLCYAMEKPLIAIDTLAAMAEGFKDAETQRRKVNSQFSTILCPMIDARRMEAYTTIYNRALKEARKVQADIIDEHTYDEWLNKGVVYFFGNGAEKCKEVIKHQNARFIDNIHPSARMMLPLAELAIAKNDYVDVAYFEPFYLKEFVAIKSKSLLEP